ncbi:hypothetical protein [Arthrobacter livingstonensis]|nr:hypothetical protein [Arthrobacter livingstonensis]
MFAIRRYPVLVLAACAALALGGCSGGTTAARSTAPTVTPGATPPGTTTGGTAQAAQPSTQEGSPSQAPASSAQPAAGDDPTVMPVTASPTLFYIAQGDAGVSGPTVGCGDSAVAVTGAAISFTDPVEGALRTLLADHSQQLGQSGLDNALWQSSLEVLSVDRAGSVITAHLAGTLKLGGECDIPRVEQQLLLTAEKAAGAPVAITINGKTLSSALSLK